MFYKMINKKQLRISTGKRIIIACICCQKNPIKNRNRNAIYCKECSGYIRKYIARLQMKVAFRSRIIKALRNKLFALESTIVK